MGNQPEPTMTVTTDELDARISELFAHREAVARRAAEEAAAEGETARKAELDDWRQLRISTEERMVKDRSDLRELTDRLDRERAEAIEKFWRERP